MDERPHEARHQHGVVSTDVAGVLLLDQRIHQHLEGGLGFGNEEIIFCARLDESATSRRLKTRVLGSTRGFERYS